MHAAVAAIRSSARSDAPHAALFAVAYFVAAEVGYSLSLGPSVGGTFWPPAGVALAVFLVAPWHLWPQLLVAGLLANFVSDEVHGQMLPASIGFAIANLSEPLIGAYIVRRILPPPVTLARLPEIAVLALAAVFVAAPVGAAIGALTAEWWTETAPGFAAGWRTWWVGDSVGALVLAPCVVHVISRWRRIRALAPRRWLEAAAFTAVLIGVTEVVFSAPPTSLAMPFLVFPVLLWGSIRFGPIGVGGALCLVVLLTTHETAAGQGPFAAAHLSLGERLIALQIYVGVMAVSFHALGVLWEERARATAALRSAHSGLEARYRRIVEQSPLAILAVRPDGRVQEVNPAWRRMWLTPSSDDARVRGDRSWADPKLALLLDRAFTGEIVELPERVAAGDAAGHTGGDVAGARRVRGVAYPVKDESGRVAEVVLIERDITEEVRAQQQLVDANRTLREREEALSLVLEQMAEAQAHRERLLEAERFARGEAERASQLKDEFLATLSHELRTPLNAIVGWTHILRSKVEDPALLQGVDTVERNARALTKLIDDLLDMSRIMAGKVGLTLARTRLEEIVFAAADALRPIADTEQVEMGVDCTTVSDVWVSCDAARLQQVVANLLSNGIKFTPAGGRVDARVAVRDHEAQLIVRDSGQGISPEFLPYVFERFRQADGSTTRRHGGLGLGLSISRQIVELHGGSISVSSDGPSRGATFTVTLPLADEGTAARDGVDGDITSPLALSHLRVLVVDDEGDARELLRRFLDEQGCRVDVAGSAEEAWAYLAAGKYDVLLSDIGMPGTDGYELLRRVRAGAFDQPTAIAVTAFARPQDRDRALAAGFDAHIAKPVDPARLLSTLAQLRPDPSR